MRENLHSEKMPLRRARPVIWLIVSALAVFTAASSLSVGQQGGGPRGGPTGPPPAGLAGAAARAQQQTIDDIRDMVSMYVSVTDRQGNPIAGLKPANFVISEDGVEQEIAQFLMDTAPISLGIVWGPNIPLGDTIPTFLKASAPNTEYFLVGNDTVIAPFSTDARRAPRVIGQVDMEIFPSGGKDAMHIGLDVLSEAAAYVRRVMLVVGRANRANPVATPAFGNGVTYDSLANAAIKGDMQIYTIIVQGQASNPFAGLPPAQDPFAGRNGRQMGNQRQGTFGSPLGPVGDIDYLNQSFDQQSESIMLDGLSALTGGLSYLVQNTDTGIGNDTSELEAAADEIARGLRVQYRIGYHSTNKERDGKWRAIKITLVDMPKEVPTQLRLWYKAGYYAPKDLVKKK